MGTFSSEDIRLAQQAQEKYGVPASVTLAQYALESGYGTSNLSNKANNYFGISGKNVNTGKFVMSGGRSWAKYNSKAESFDDHGRLLSTDLYASKTAGAKSVGEYVDAIAETYAPSSDGNNGYAAALKKIISDNNLTQYDTTASYNGVTNVAVNDQYEEDGFIGKVVKFVALLLVGILAAVFFFSAFEINLDPKKAIEKVVVSGGN